MVKKGFGHKFINLITALPGSWGIWSQSPMQSWVVVPCSRF